MPRSLRLKVKYQARLAQLLLLPLKLLRIRYPIYAIQSEKQIITQKYQELNLNILPHLIIINLPLKYLIIRKKKNNQLKKLEISGFIDNTNLDEKIVTLEAKSELKADQEKITKFQTFDSSYFCDNGHFEDDATQVYLIFQSISISLKGLVTAFVFQREYPSLNYIGNKSRIKFDSQCLKQDKVTFTHKNLENIYIVYKINLWGYKLCDDFSLFGERPEKEKDQ